MGGDVEDAVGVGGGGATGGDDGDCRGGGGAGGDGSDGGVRLAQATRTYTSNSPPQLLFVEFVPHSFELLSHCSPTSSPSKSHGGSENENVDTGHSLSSTSIKQMPQLEPARDRGKLSSPSSKQPPNIHMRAKHSFCALATAHSLTHRRRRWHSRGMAQSEAKAASAAPVEVAGSEDGTRNRSAGRRLCLKDCSCWRSHPCHTRRCQKSRARRHQPLRSRAGQPTRLGSSPTRQAGDKCRSSRLHQTKLGPPVSA